MRWRPAAAAVVSVLVFLVVPTPPAYARYNCPPKTFEPEKLPGVPLEDRLYAPKTLASVAVGSRSRPVRVAVIDSGVDAKHPQLDGKVDAGKDYLHRDPDGRQDCNGHGTAVASIIAARPVAGTGFQGLAPDVRIVPIRVSEDDGSNEQAPLPASSETVAEAIDWAVRYGQADVINMSLTTDGSDALAAAVGRAIDAGVVVVAAVGNYDINKQAPPPYPAKYPDVIGVGAITPSGVIAEFSVRNANVDLAAIGDSVTAAVPRGGRSSKHNGTSFAAPFVAATAALIKQRWPDATPAQVQRRLLATADPAPGGAYSEKYGYGLLNPYRAVTETLGPMSPAQRVPQVGPAVDPAAVERARRRAEARDTALLIAVIGAGAVLLIAVAAAAARRGRRRGWRPAVTGQR